MIGLGTVGSAVAERLISAWELLTERAGATPVLRRVAVRDAMRTRDIDLRNVSLDGDGHALVDDPGVSIVVEVMGGVDEAAAFVEHALERGKSVVTANKALMATHGPRLWDLAASRGAGLWFEASVGAGLPIVALLRDSLRGDSVTNIDAIINTTTNVILTLMHDSGDSIDVALEDARRRGFAEADASSDLEGWDAAYKLAILAWLAFGHPPAVDEIDRAGVTQIDRGDVGYAAQLGYTMKLIAHAERTDSTLHLRVRPTLVPEQHRLGHVDDSDNAVIISTDLAGTVML